jgi:hypothetical protein
MGAILSSCSVQEGGAVTRPPTSSPRSRCRCRSGLAGQVGRSGWFSPPVRHPPSTGGAVNSDIRPAYRPAATAQGVSEASGPGESEWVGLRGGAPTRGEGALRFDLLQRVKGEANGKWGKGWL